jgi:hypothetical protein
VFAFAEVELVGFIRPVQCVAALRTAADAPAIHEQVVALVRTGHDPDADVLGESEA